MSEFDPDKSVAQAFTARLAANYELTDQNVAKRFRYYELAEPKIDFVAKIIDKLQLTGSETIASDGASSMGFEYRLQTEYAHKGILIGLEPYERQLKNHSVRWPWYQDQPNPRRTVLAKSWAHELPLHNDSVDVFTELFMRYHIPDDLQDQAFSEVKRVLKPGGRFVLATSGQKNKFVHRGIERMLAEDLGIEAPPYMNENFTSEKAKLVLPKYFKNVEHYNHDAIVENDWSNKRILCDSVETLLDQFSPAIKSEAARRIATKRIAVIVDRMLEHTSGIDLVQRQFSICSDPKDL